MSDSKTKIETVTVEKRSGADANASVTKDGKTATGKGESAQDALRDAKQKAKD